MLTEHISSMYIMYLACELLDLFALSYILYSIALVSQVMCELVFLINFYYVGEESTILKIFSSNKDKLIISFTFEQHWLANELYDKGFIDSKVKNDVTNIQSVFNEDAKAGMIYDSVLNRITINEGDNIEKLKVILSMKKVYEDTISLQCKELKLLKSMM